MDKYLSFVSLDTWTLIFTWVNLLILFLVLKRFFFKPMENMLKERGIEIENDYRKAESTKNAANKIKAEYDSMMIDAKNRAEKIVNSAKKSAEKRSSVIINDAESKAEEMIKRAEKEIENSRETAFNQLKGEVSSMAVSIAEKIIKKDIDKNEHERLIQNALESLGGNEE